MHSPDHSHEHLDQHTRAKAREERALRTHLWNEQQRGVNKLLEVTGGKNPEHVYDSKELTKAFLRKVAFFLGCMDDRVAMKDKSNRWMAKIGIGANGRLLTPLLFEKFVKNIKDVFTNLLKMDYVDIQVTYHALCGACKEFCDQQNPERIGLGLDPLDAVKAGELIATEIMNALEIEGDPTFVPSNWLYGSEKFHPARACLLYTSDAADE